jgi:hypothetical protein
MTVEANVSAQDRLDEAVAVDSLHGSAADRSELTYVRAASLFDVVATGLPGGSGPWTPDRVSLSAAIRDRGFPAP